MALSLRGWGEGADAGEEECVALEWLATESGPGCRWSTQRKPHGRGSQSSAFCGCVGSVAIGPGRAGEASGGSDPVWRLSASVIGS